MRMQGRSQPITAGTSAMADTHSRTGGEIRSRRIRFSRAAECRGVMARHRSAHTRIQPAAVYTENTASPGKPQAYRPTRQAIRGTRRPHRPGGHRRAFALRRDSGDCQPLDGGKRHTHPRRRGRAKNRVHKYRQHRQHHQAPHGVTEARPRSADKEIRREQQRRQQRSLPYEVQQRPADRLHCRMD